MMSAKRIAGVVATGAVALAGYAGGTVQAEAASAPSRTAASSDVQTFKNQAYGGCMDDKGGTLWLRKCSGSSVQKWDVFHTDGKVRLTNKSSGACLRDTYGSGLVTGSCYGSKEEDFRVTRWNDGTIRFQSTWTRECIDVDSDGDIGTRKCDTSKSQSWS